MEVIWAKRKAEYLCQRGWTTQITLNWLGKFAYLISAGCEEIMPVRPIVRYPDPRLALPALPVTAFDGALRDLAGDLLDTMHAAPGIGITAPHIGISLRVVVLDLNATDGARTYVNPEIIWASREMIMHREGSVSMPDVSDEISRHARIRINFRDVDGTLQTEESDGLRAVCHQHEIDQLNGLFWINRLSRLKRERLIKRFEKLSRSNTAGLDG
jgi:peptide deformylase